MHTVCILEAPGCNAARLGGYNTVCTRCRSSRLARLDGCNTVCTLSDVDDARCARQPGRIRRTVCTPPYVGSSKGLANLGVSSTFVTQKEVRMH